MTTPSRFNWMRTGVALLALSLSTLAPPTQAGGHHGSMKAAGKNIVETAASAGTFETLIAAAKAAGLAGALTGDGPLTVFAPTDEAFGALPAGTIETLLKPENKDQLARILKFHVVSGRVASSALRDGITVKTLAGARAAIAQTEQGFAIEGARIVATDIDASNGVVHVIDRVILPPEMQAQNAEALEIIDLAIDAGVPMFNHGNARATEAIYTVAAESLLRLGSLEADEERRLKRGLKESRYNHDARESAWRLRYALDDVEAALRDGDVDTRMTMNR